MLIKFSRKPKAVTSPEEVHKLLQSVLKTGSQYDRDQEHFWVLHLTGRNTVRALHLVSLGTIDSALVHPREVFTRAVGERCAKIVLAHNHPSRDPQPSSEDISVTDTLVKAGEILGIEVVDHVITAGRDFYSFKQEGRL